MLFGVEVGQQDLNTRNANTIPQRLPGVPLFGFVPSPSKGEDGPDISDPTTIREVDSTVIGLYAQDQITLSPHWKGLVGLRYDYFDIEVDNILPVPLATDLRPERTDNEISPRAGLIYQPTETSSLYASYSRSFQPSGEVLNLAQNRINLEPEITSNYEIGGKIDLLDGKLSAGVAVFRLEKTNQRTTPLIPPS